MEAFLKTDSAEAGVYCHLFFYCLTTGTFKTAFDGEVAALQVALAQLHCYLNSFTRAVVFCDSKMSLSEYSKKIVLQWIPGHCGVTGYEFEDHLAKKEAFIK
ncbi:hypothetical protein TNCV_2167611 [Trichonephila clavipes]|nr:hypothetical protein TNCV_2167611 [Trichonephila clavipes]